MRWRAVLVFLTLVGACAEPDREAAQMVIFVEGVGFRGGPDRLGVLPGSMDTQPVEAWSFDTGNHVISSPVPLERGIVVVGDDGVLRRVDSGGSSEWTLDLGDAESTPAVAGSAVAAMSSSVGWWSCPRLTGVWGGR